MSDEKEKNPALKRSWFQNLKAEFGKIAWPSRSKVGKETTVVVVVAVLLAGVIIGIDELVQFGLNFLW